MYCSHEWVRWSSVVARLMLQWNDRKLTMVRLGSTVAMNKQRQYVPVRRTKTINKNPDLHDNRNHRVILVHHNRYSSAVMKMYWNFVAVLMPVWKVCTVQLFSCFSFLHRHLTSYWHTSLFKSIKLWPWQQVSRSHYLWAKLAQKTHRSSKQHKVFL